MLKRVIEVFVVDKITIGGMHSYKLLIGHWLIVKGLDELSWIDNEMKCVN